MTVAKVSGVFLSILGVILIFSNQTALDTPSALWGSAAIVIGAFAVAYSNVLVKARCGHIDPAVLASCQMIFGLVPLLTIGLVLEGNPLKIRWTMLSLASLFYLAVVGSAVAFMLFYWLVRHMEVTRTMLIPLVTPVMAVVLGMVVLKEEITWRIALGAAAIMSGIALTALNKLRKSRVWSLESKQV
jgi:drug/metabolite transporter (DMT)-like permease